MNIKDFLKRKRGFLKFFFTSFVISYPVFPSSLGENESSASRPFIQNHDDTASSRDENLVNMPQSGLVSSTNSKKGSGNSSSVDETTPLAQVPFNSSQPIAPEVDSLFHEKFNPDLVTASFNSREVPENSFPSRPPSPVDVPITHDNPDEQEAFISEEGNLAGRSSASINHEDQRANPDESIPPPAFRHSLESELDPELKDLLDNNPINNPTRRLARALLNNRAAGRLCCLNFWSSMNGPLGVLSLASSSLATLVTGLGAAAASSGNAGLARGFAIAGTVTSVFATIMGGFKMYAATRGASEIEGIIADYMGRCLDHLEALRTVSRKLQTRAGHINRLHPGTYEAKKYQADFEEAQLALERYQEDMKDTDKHAENIRGLLAKIANAQSREQSFVLTPLQNTAVLSGMTSTSQLNYEELPENFKRFQECMAYYYLCSLGCYQLLEGPAGYINIVAAVSGAALTAFSIFYTGDVQEGLLWGATAANVTSMVASAHKFFAGSRIKSGQESIMNLRLNRSKKEDSQEQSVSDHQDNSDHDSR